VHVDAERAAVDLRHPQVHQIDQFPGETALLQRAINGAERLVGWRSS
jgi:hypothetical protein